jgi:predicted nucleic acid-binding protein
MLTLIIDSNVLISALIKNGFTRKILTHFDLNFVFPEYGIEEIYSYKKLIMKKSGINEKEFDVLLLRLLKYIQLIPLDMIIKYRIEANDIMGKIDKKDVPFIAAALALNCSIWSDDKHFKKQKEIKIFTTKEVMEIYRNE